MKDYYKILGVGEDASTEEIRASWIELTKHYHPDLRKTNGKDEKIKEINEAYEVLKDDSKRLDYDLQRTIKKSICKKIHAGREKMSLSKKVIFSAGLMVFFLMVGLILFKSHRVPIQPKSELRFEISKILEKRPVPPVPPPKVKKEVKGEEREEVKEEVIVERKTRKEIEEAVKEPKKSEPKEERTPKAVTKSDARGPEEKGASTEKEPKRKEEVVPREVMESKMPEKMDKEVPKEVPKEAPKEVPKETPKEAPKEVLLEVSIDVRKDVPKEVPREAAKVISQESARIDQPRPILTEPQPVQAPKPLVKADSAMSPSYSLLVKEEEVKQFLSSYINRYTEKDINGFLSFFSSKAVQNQKDDFEKIRSIYTKFFDQSEELRYGLEGLKAEIYQNSVEVKARYKVYQKLKKRGEEKIWAGNIRWILVKEEGAFRISLLDFQDEKSP